MRGALRVFVVVAILVVGSTTLQPVNGALTDPGTGGEGTCQWCGWVWEDLGNGFVVHTFGCHPLEPGSPKKSSRKCKLNEEGDSCDQSEFCQIA